MVHAGHKSDEVVYIGGINRGAMASLKFKVSPWDYNYFYNRKPLQFSNLAPLL